MKKLLSLLLVCVFAVATLASCGSSKLYDYNYDAYVVLGSYKGVEVSVSDIQKEFDEQIDSILTSNAKDVDTKAAAVEGNKVVYNLSAVIGGEAVSALAKTGASIKLGTGKTGIDELDKAFVGMSVDETKEVTAVVPAKHTGKEEIDGKEATFTIKVTAVTESVKPEALTDEMVSTATDKLYTTVADYETYLRSAIKQNLVWDKVLGSTKFVDTPKKEAEMYYENYLASYTSTAAQYGMTLSSLASIYGMTSDEFQHSLAQQAVAQVNQDMAILSLAAKESIVPDEAKIADVKAEMMVYYGYKTEEELMAVMDEDSIVRSATYDLVMKFLEENALEVEKTTETEKAE